MEGTNKVRAMLARAPGLTAEHARALLTAAGCEADLNFSRSLLREAGIPPAASAYLSSPSEAELNADLRWIDSSGAQLILCTEAAYPPMLAQTAGGPAVLFVLGSVEALRSPQLAMVGARKPTAAGCKKLIDIARETLRGDKVMATDTTVPLNFMPAPPRSNVHGQIIAVVDGTDLIGQWQIVAINRGTRDGVNNGTVLAVDRAGERIRDVYSNGSSMTRKAYDVDTSFAKRVKLPDERTGTMLVFRAFDRMSYALIIGATDTMRVHDAIRNP